MSARGVALRIGGRVQGVGFRAFTRHEATRLACTGWVVNRSDGSVEVALYGPGAALGELIGALRQGPPGAAVDNLDVRSVDRETTEQVPPGGYPF